MCIPLRSGWTPSQRVYLQKYLAGLLPELGQKNAEANAYLWDLDRQPLQKFVRQIAWLPV